MFRRTISLTLVIFLGAISLLAFVLSNHSAQAQNGEQDAATPTPTPTPTPISEELRRLRERNAILEEKKTAAVLEKDILEARFPKPTATPLEGKTTISDGAIIESQAMSYAALARAADVIACQLNRLQGKEDSTCDNKTTAPLPPQPTPTPLSAPIKKLAIYEGDEINQLLGYGIAKDRSELMGNEYGRLIAPATSTLETLAPPTTIARSFLGSIVDLTALLRTNVDVKGVSINMEKESLVSEVFRAAKEKGLGVDLYYPAKFPINIEVKNGYDFLSSLEKLRGMQSVASQLVADWMENDKKIAEAIKQQESQVATHSSVQGQTRQTKERLKRLHEIGCPGLPGSDTDRITRLEDLLSSQQREERELTEKDLRELRRKKCTRWSMDMELQIEDMESLYASLMSKEKELKEKVNATATEITRLKNDVRGKLILMLHSDWRATEARIDEAMTRLKALNDQFDQFVSALSKVDEATGLNLITSYLKTERMNAVLGNKESYWLQLQVVKAGGNNRIKTNLLVDVFTGGNRVSHSGGAIVQYVLFDSEGKAVAADTIPVYTGYIKSKKIEELFR